MHRLFFMLGAFFILSGLFYYFGERLGIGKLPGDLSFKSGNYQVHFPIVTCILISAALSGIVWLVNHFRS